MNIENSKSGILPNGHEYQHVFTHSSAGQLAFLNLQAELQFVHHYQCDSWTISHSDPICQNTSLLFLKKLDAFGRSSNRSKKLIERKTITLLRDMKPPCCVSCSNNDNSEWKVQRLEGWVKAEDTRSSHHRGLETQMLVSERAGSCHQEKVPPPHCHSEAPKLLRQTLKFSPGRIWSNTQEYNLLWPRIPSLFRYGRAKVFAPSLRRNGPDWRNGSLLHSNQVQRRQSGKISERVYPWRICSVFFLSK